MVFLGEWQDCLAKKQKDLIYGNIAQSWSVQTYWIREGQRKDIENW